jgi:hypothetical protein
MDILSFKLCVKTPPCPDDLFLNKFRINNNTASFPISALFSSINFSDTSIIGIIAVDTINGITIIGNILVIISFSSFFLPSTNSDYKNMIYLVKCTFTYIAARFFFGIIFIRPSRYIFTDNALCHCT